MANLQVKDVPAEVHDELRRRAEQRGVSVRDYVLELVRRDQATPTPEEWVAAIDRLPRIGSDVPVTEFLHAERDRGTTGPSR